MKVGVARFDMNTNGIALIRATVIDGSPSDFIINHVPPEGLDIEQINIDELYKELLCGLDFIMEDAKPSEGQELLFFMEYCKEAAPLL